MRSIHTIEERLPPPNTCCGLCGLPMHDDLAYYIHAKGTWGYLHPRCLLELAKKSSSTLGIDHVLENRGEFARVFTDVTDVEIAPTDFTPARLRDELRSRWFERRNLADGTPPAVGQRVVIVREVAKRWGLSTSDADRVHEITSLLGGDTHLVECGSQQIGVGMLRLAPPGSEVTCESCRGWREQLARLRIDAEVFRERQVKERLAAATKGSDATTAALEKVTRERDDIRTERDSLREKLAKLHAEFDRHVAAAAQIYDARDRWMKSAEEARGEVDELRAKLECVEAERDESAQSRDEWHASWQNTVESLRAVKRDRDALRAERDQIREDLLRAERAESEAVEAAYRVGQMYKHVTEQRSALAAPFDLASFFDDKAIWSRQTFGPGDRGPGIVAHIRKELAEIEAKPGDVEEWVDVVLLAMDGAWRSAGADGAEFVAALVDKDRRNRTRSWPDWRTLTPDQVSEHIPDDGWKSCDTFTHEKRLAPDVVGRIYGAAAFFQWSIHVEEKTQGQPLTVTLFDKGQESCLVDAKYQVTRSWENREESE